MDNKITKSRISNHLEYDWFKYIIILGVVIALVVFAFTQINANRDDETFTLFFTSYSSKQLTSSDYEKYDFTFNVNQKMKSDDYTKQLLNGKSHKDIYGPSILRSVSFDFAQFNTSEYSTLYSTRGAITSDALIVAQSTIRDYKSPLAEGEEEKPDTFLSAGAYLELTDDILKLLGISDDGKDSYGNAVPFTTSDFELLRIDPETGERVETGGKVYAIRIDNNNNEKGLSNIDKIASLKYTPTDENDTTDYDEVFYLVINRSSKNIGTYGGKKVDAKNNQTFYALRTFLEIYR